jgi:tRNA pseudouridine38-40 synthase
MNVKITVSYDGSIYKGSQKQPNKLAVEDKLIEAFLSLDINSKIVFSGRTDKNVHATGQVFNIKIQEFWTDLKKFKDVVNRKLPLSIKITRVEKVCEDFNARFWAKKRVYRYLVTTKSTTPFNAKYVTYVSSINEKLIKKAIKYFEGEHDFEFFHKKGSDKEYLIRTIYETKFYKYKDIYVFKFKANSYLRSQIRLMVGFLLKVSQEKLTIDDLRDQLNRKRHISRFPADGNGLYLTKVIY